MAAPVIVQGITGRYGSLHTSLMLQYGTNVAAGVTPGKAGERVEGVKVYDKVADAVQKTGARSSIIFVPAPYLLLGGGGGDARGSSSSSR